MNKRLFAVIFDDQGEVSIIMPGLSKAEAQLPPPIGAVMCAMCRYLFEDKNQDLADALESRMKEDIEAAVKAAKQ